MMGNASAANNCRLCWAEKIPFVSKDNRRLTIAKLSLPADTKVPVNQLTAQEAGKKLADLLNPDRVAAGHKELTPDQAIKKRYQSKDGGFSINIKCPDNGCRTVDQTMHFVESPFMVSIPGFQ